MDDESGKVMNLDMRWVNPLVGLGRVALRLVESAGSHLFQLLVVVKHVVSKCASLQDSHMNSFSLRSRL